MSRARGYRSGEWKALCDVCGTTFLSSELTKRWDNLMVCAYDWEPRQPQDFVRASVDKMAVPWSRPEPSDTYIQTTCNPETTSSIPGYAQPGCAIPGQFFPEATPSGTFTP